MLLLACYQRGSFKLERQSRNGRSWQERRQAHRQLALLSEEKEGLRVCLDPQGSVYSARSICLRVGAAHHHHGLWASCSLLIEGRNKVLSKSLLSISSESSAVRSLGSSHRHSRNKEVESTEIEKQNPILPDLLSLSIPQSPTEKDS